MSYRSLKIASILTVTGLSVVAVVAVVALRLLPAGTQLPTHWGASGEADRFADASTALFMPVFIAAGISLMMAVLPAIEPLQHRLEQSASLFATAWAGLLLLSVVVELMVAGPALGLRMPKMTILAMMGLLFLALGNALPKSRPGFFVGIRTPWTLIDPDNWIATHRLGGWTFVVGGILMIGAAFAPIAADIRASLTIAALTIAVVPPVIYSFVHWRRHGPSAG